MQHFKTNHGYFLGEGWHDFDKCLALCVEELRAALRRAHGAGKSCPTRQWFTLPSPTTEARWISPAGSSRDTATRVVSIMVSMFGDTCTREIRPLRLETQWLVRELKLQDRTPPPRRP